MILFVLVAVDRVVSIAVQYLEIDHFGEDMFLSSFSCQPSGSVAALPGSAGLCLAPTGSAALGLCG